MDEEMDEPLRSRMRREKGDSTPGSGYRSMRRSKPHNERGNSFEKYQGVSSSRRNKSKSSSDVEEDDLISYPSRKSPFLNPIAASLLDEDVEDLTEEDLQLKFQHDDDAQLQAAIASSLGQPFQVSQQILGQTHRAYCTEEKSQTIPEDVQRIRKLRENALKQASKDTKPAHEIPLLPTNAITAFTSRNHEAESARHGAEEENTISTEEMRRRRLARFEGQ